MQRLPEAQGTVAGGELGIEHQAILVAQPQQQLAPALGALPKAILDRQELLAAARIGADQHEHALAIVF